MANFKFVKSATALVLGASVLTTAVVAQGTSASAKTTYKVTKSGTLVNAKTNKTVKGYASYKGKLYSNGKKLTGLYKGKYYYKSGVKATGTYKGAFYYKGYKKVTTGTYNGAYYYKGVKKVTTGTYNKAYYVKGKKVVTSGTYNGKYYRYGVLFTGKTSYGNYYYKGVRFTGVTTSGYTYYNGKPVEGEYKGLVYTNGKVVTGVYKDKLYTEGELESGLDLNENKLYKDGVLNVGYTLYNNSELYKDENKNTGWAINAVDGKTYLDTALASDTYTDANGVETAYENGVEVGAKVKAVEAINAVEFKVTFNKTVSKDSLATSDFTVTDIATNAAITPTDVELSEDGKSVVVLLPTAVPVTGVSVDIAEGVILSKDFDKFAKSTTAELNAPKDTTAPKLLSAVADGANIELTFDEPVDWTQNSPVANIDQVAATTQPANSTTAGKYVYTIAAASALADGKHSVDLTNVTDFAGNTDVLVSKDLTVTADTSAAKVASIKANDSTSFIVEFNKAVTLPTAANFEIKKGNLTLDAANFTVTPTLVDKDGNAAVGASSKYVKVTLADTVGNTVNPLYATNENSIALAVKVSGYTDASSVLGTEFSGSVTLAKDLTAPAIKSEKLITSTATTIVLPFTKTVTGTTANTVTVKQGNVLVAQTPGFTGTDKNLTLTFGAGDLVPGKTYTITLAKGAAVSGTQSSEATTITYTVPETTVQYTTTAATVTPSKVNGKNVLTVAYADEVNDAAALASSYKLNGAALPAGTDVYFASSAKTSVVIELPTSYAVDTESKAAKFSINADTVKYADTAAAAVADKYVSGSATAGTANEQAITLKDNVAPTLVKAEYVKNAAGLATGVKLTFSENVKDSTLDAANFVITQGTTNIAWAITGSPAVTDLANDKVLQLDFTTPVTASGVVVKTNTDTAKQTLEDANTNLLGSISATSVQ